MAREYSVYKHIVPNGKIYIGISHNPQGRWNNGEGYRDNGAFYADIKKYGWDAIKHEIVETGLNYDDALRIESILIAQLKSCEPDKGYNRTAQNREAKSKRAQFLIKPSVYEGIKKIAIMEQTSVNEIVNGLLEECVLNNQKLLEKYEEVFGK